MNTIPPPIYDWSTPGFGVRFAPSVIGSAIAWALYGYSKSYSFVGIDYRLLHGQLRLPPGSRRGQTDENHRNPPICRVWRCSYRIRHQLYRPQPRSGQSYTHNSSTFAEMFRSDGSIWLSSFL
jgi:hypothetical protein